MSSPKKNNFPKRIQNSLKIINEVSRSMGIHHVLRVTVSYLFYKLFRSSRTFTFNGKEYKYFIHTYNPTWRKERSVEIPIIKEIVRKFKGKEILEVGNVLSHYYPVNHDILDKYRKNK